MSIHEKLQEAIDLATKMEKQSSQLAIKLALQVGGMVDEMRELKARSKSALEYLDACTLNGESIGKIDTVMMSKRDYLRVRKILGEINSE